MLYKIMKWKKSTLILFIGLIFLFLGIGIPIIINELYKINSGYTTLWDAADTLSFYSVILSGLLSVGILVITIFYNRSETERQVRAAFSQTKAPFFIVQNILPESRVSCVYNKNGNTRKVQYTIRKCEAIKLTIQLKNIGDGPAISLNYATEKPEIQISFKDSLLTNQVPLYVQSDDLLELTCEFSQLFLSAGLMDESSKSIDAHIELSYKNTFGISYSQNILLKCERVPDIPRTVIFSADVCSYQSFVSDL